jgi:fructose-1,6-bisphosphatase/inositol monophosphatase family enzyme
VQEAGGTVTTANGQAFHSSSGSVLATNAVIHDEMLEIIGGFLSRFRSQNGTE